MILTKIRSPRARITCNGASSVKYATMLEAPDDALINMVNAKSMMRALIGKNA